MPLFGRGYTGLREFFMLIEELLTLFRGKMHLEVFKYLAANKECHYILEEFGPTETYEEYFSVEYQHHVVSEADNLLNELNSLIREEINFFGSLVCTVCSPWGNTAFNIAPEGSTLTVHYDTCNQILETQEIQIRLLEFTVNHLQPLAKLISCSWNVEENPDYVISDMTLAKVTRLEETVNKCKASPDKNVPACQTICAKSLFEYKVSNPLTRTNLRALYRQ